MEWALRRVPVVALLFVIFLVAVPAAMILPMMLLPCRTGWLPGFAVVFATACWYLAWRLFRYHGRAEEDLAHKLYAALSCAVAVGPVLV